MCCPVDARMLRHRPRTALIGPGGLQHARAVGHRMDGDVGTLERVFPDHAVGIERVAAVPPDHAVGIEPVAARPPALLAARKTAQVLILSSGDEHRVGIWIPASPSKALLCKPGCRHRRRSVCDSRSVCRGRCWRWHGSHGWGRRLGARGKHHRGIRRCDPFTCRSPQLAGGWLRHAIGARSGRHEAEHPAIRQGSADHIGVPVPAHTVDPFLLGGMRKKGIVICGLDQE